MNAPFISVIIPTYNRGKSLSVTLDSFLTQTYPLKDMEIIVSNNNSTDDTAQVLKGYAERCPNIVPLLEPRQGVHYARNSAAKSARGEILYFTDDDMIADPKMIEEIIKVFSIDESIGVATGLIVGKFEKEPPAWVSRYMINSYLSLTGKERNEDLIVSTQDFGVYSCHQAIKRTVFFESGGFNPENTRGVWIGDGETGLNIKIKALGHKFAFTSASKTSHMIPNERTTLSYIVKRLGNQGFCDAYTKYRAHRSRSILLQELIIRNLWAAPKRVAKVIVSALIRRTDWRFIPAFIAYYFKQNVYDFKILRNNDFRLLVEKDNWLKDE